MKQMRQNEGCVIPVQIFCCLPKRRQIRRQMEVVKKSRIKDCVGTVYKNIQGDQLFALSKRGMRKSRI